MRLCIYTVVALFMSMPNTCCPTTGCLMSHAISLLALHRSPSPSAASVLLWQFVRIIWNEAYFAELARQNVTAIISLNASPYYVGRRQQRLDHFAKLCHTHQCALVYCNRSGAQDSLVFDGASMVLDANGTCVATAHEHQDHTCVVAFDGRWHGSCQPALPPEAALFQALVVATRCYVRDSGFTRVVLGLSGGIDSALVVVIACHALGADNVAAYMLEPCLHLPSQP